MSSSHTIRKQSYSNSILKLWTPSEVSLSMLPYLVSYSSLSSTQSLKAMPSSSSNQKTPKQKRKGTLWLLSFTYQKVPPSCPIHYASPIAETKGDEPIRVHPSHGQFPISNHRDGNSSTDNLGPSTAKIRGWFMTIRSVISFNAASSRARIFCPAWVIVFGEGLSCQWQKHHGCDRRVAFSRWMVCPGLP